MGGKMPKMPEPPPVDTSVQDKMAASEAKLAAEKKKAISARMKGRGGTILTGGTGLEDEASTAATSLMKY